MLVHAHRERELARAQAESLRELQLKCELLEKTETIRDRMSRPWGPPAIGDAAAGDFPTKWPMSQPENAIGTGL